MAEQQDYIARVLSEASEEDRAGFGKSEPSLFRELQYGFEKSTFMGADAARLAEASTGERTIEEIEAERLAKINAKFGELSQESKESWTAFGGEIIGEAIDPTLLALGPVGLAAKGAKIGKLGQRAYSTAYGAGLFGSDAALEIAARGEDVTASGVALATILGGVGGAFVKPLVKGGDEVATGVKTVQPSKITESEDIAVKEILAEVDGSNPSLIGALEDVPNMGAKIAEATATRQRYREEYVKFKGKQAGALSKAELDDLRLARDKAKLFTQSLPEQMRKNSEIISDSLIETTDKLAKNGMLNGSTIGRVLTRPLLGAGIGYGAGVTNQLVSEEDTVSPLAFMTVGLLGGQLSKKILKTDYSTNVKEEGLKSLQDLNKNLVKAQVNVLGSGTTAARLNSFGGDVSAFGKTLLAQRGADLKGVATVSVEEAKDIAIQDLTNVFDIRMMELGGLGDDSKALREAAWKYGEKFVDEGDLANQGFNKAQIVTIKEISESSKGIVNTVSSEAESVGIKFTKLEDYALPQMHDAKKISDNRDAAIVAYADAFTKQNIAKTKEAMLLKDPKADVSKVKISEKQLESSKARAISYVDEIINLGYSGKRLNTWKSKSEGDLTDFKLRLTPLSDHFEKDRIFTDFEARKSIQDFLVQDVAEIIPDYVSKSMPNIEFARAFGAKGDAIFQLKRSIQLEAQAGKKAAGSDGKLYKLAEKVRAEKIKNIHNSVDMYFGTYGSQSSRATSEAATSTLSLMTMMGNMTMLTKVTLDSVGDLVQPFVNSGFSSSMRGKARTNSKELTDFAESTGFAKRDVLSQELRALSLDKNTAGSKVQNFAAKTNETFFKVIGLGKLTSYARRFAYNTGIENAFDIAQEVTAKGMTQTVFNKAKALGLTDDYIQTLQKFKNVDEAFDDKDGRRILNIAGIKASDRDALIPQVGNRLGFSQSKDPLIRSLGQFLSWAQAKTTQTNALVQRIEDGDAALAARALGSLVVYDGLITLKQYFNDPTGKYLDDDVDSFTEKLVTREQLGASIMQAGVSPYYLNKIVAMAARPYGSTVFSNLAPSISLIEDYAKLGTATVKNIEQGDVEGLALQYLRRVPGGKEVEDILAATGNELKDRGAKEKEAPAGRLTTLGFNKGGEVLDVPNAPVEPDQRIDKMTGQPYDQQAGTAFVDQEDPLRRLGFKGGGEVDPLSRLGFGIGSLVSKGFAKLTGNTADASDDVFKKEFDDLTKAIDKGETPKMFKGVLPVQHASSEKSLKEFIDPSDVKDSARYPENEFGNNAVYFGEKNSPFTNTEGMYGYEPSPFLYDVEAKFDNAFVLTPQSIKELSSLVPEKQRRFGGSVADVLKSKGYDGLIIRGFDNSNKTQKIIDQAEKKDKFFYGIFQDQVVSFDPKKNKILGGPEVRKGFSGRDRDIAANMTEEDISKWQEVNKLPESKRQKQRPEIIQSLQKVLSGNKSIEEHNKLTDEVFPPSLYTKDNAPEFPTLVEVRGAVGKKTLTGGRGIIGSDVDVEEGRRVSSRLDIPAYDQRGVWAVTLHELGKGGKAFAYGQSAILKNVDFTTDSKAALDIALGQAKGTIARIEGDWVNHNPIETYQQALDLLDSDEWIQVGMNPYKHSYFYDKATMKPVKSASEVIQVGPLVLARKDKGLVYADVEDFNVDLSPESIKGKKKLKDNDINIKSVSFNSGGKVLNVLKRKQYQKGSEVRSDMRRSDGSTKSARGYLGPIKNNVDGGTMTEFATNWEDAGIEIPTMVPTLSKEEIKYMQNMKPGQGWNVKENPIDKQIINKAREHARMRIDQGKSPFYQDGE